MKNFLRLACALPSSLLAMDSSHKDFFMQQQETYRSLLVQIIQKPIPNATSWRDHLSASEHIDLLIACYSIGNRMSAQEWRDSEYRAIYRDLAQRLGWHQDRPYLVRCDSTNSLGACQTLPSNAPHPDRIRHDAILLYGAMKEILHELQGDMRTIETKRQEVDPHVKEKISTETIDLFALLYDTDLYKNYQKKVLQLLLMAQRFDRDVKEHNNGACNARPFFDTMHDLIKAHEHRIKAQAIALCHKKYGFTDSHTSQLQPIQSIKESIQKLSTTADALYKTYNGYGWQKSLRGVTFPNEHASKSPDAHLPPESPFKVPITRLLENYRYNYDQSCKKLNS